MSILAAETFFGPGSTPWEWAEGVLFIAAFVGLFFVVGWGILQLLRGTKKITDRFLARAFTEIESAASSPDDGPLVDLKFTLYTMFLLWGEQRVIEVKLPHKHARALLRKMLKHNLIKGWLGPGGIFVPFLTIGEYAQQKKNLDRQLASDNGVKYGKEIANKL